MAERICVPRYGWTRNVLLRSWAKEDGAWVTSGSTICLISVEDQVRPIVAHSDGFLHLRRPIPRPGTLLHRHVELGTIIGLKEDIQKLSWGPPLPPRASRRIDRRLAAKLTGLVAPRRPRSTPRARHLAALHRIELDAIVGTGQDGRIRARDVEQQIPVLADQPTKITLRLPEEMLAAAAEPAASLADVPASPAEPAATETAGTTATFKTPEREQEEFADVSSARRGGGRSGAFVAADWPCAAAAEPACHTESVAVLRESETLPRLLGPLAELLRQHPSLLCEPPGEGPLCIEVIDLDARRAHPRSLLWSDPPSAARRAAGDAKALSRDEGTAHFHCYVLMSPLAHAAMPLVGLQRAVLTVGPACLVASHAERETARQWQRRVTLSFDPALVDWWQAMQFLRALCDIDSP